MIKEIDKIPATLQEKRQSYREMIRRDIEYAYKNRIQTFEFEGDYNYKYLAQYAREEADYFVRRMIIRPEAIRVREAMKKEFPDVKYVCVESEFKYKNRLIQIRSHKAEDRIHVYGQINFDEIDGFYEILLKDSRAENIRREKIRKGDG